MTTVATLRSTRRRGTVLCQVSSTSRQVLRVCSASRASPPSLQRLSTTTPWSSPAPTTGELSRSELLP